MCMWKKLTCPIMKKLSPSSVIISLFFTVKLAVSYQGTGIRATGFTYKTQNKV